MKEGKKKRGKSIHASTALSKYFNGKSLGTTVTTTAAVAVNAIWPFLRILWKLTHRCKLYHFSQFFTNANIAALCASVHFSIGLVGFTEKIQSLCVGESHAHLLWIKFMDINLTGIRCAHHIDAHRTAHNINMSLNGILFGSFLTVLKLKIKRDSHEIFKRFMNILYNTYM